MAMPASTWSDVPLDLIHLLARRLDVGDLVRLGAVCTSWRCFRVKDSHWLRYGPTDRGFERIPPSAVALLKLMLDQGAHNINVSDTRGLFYRATTRTL